MALCMTFVMQPAQATFVDDCNTILNAAQQSFADIFPGPLSSVTGVTSQKLLFSGGLMHFPLVVILTLLPS
jgi:hypothetical protein